MFLWLKLLAFGFALLDKNVFVKGKTQPSPSTDAPTKPTMHNTTSPSVSLSQISTPANISSSSTNSTSITPTLTKETTTVTTQKPCGKLCLIKVK
ncbi:receptor-type tyrosine-protein phosphatase C-like [Emydura macquarii macquarii]|uniref:receptor-type tyrosine-protein phosphatase C-like n=1 Tax=Emydura macquarii macquarii TaxID=1129001 RepID=UPI00352AA94B